MIIIRRAWLAGSVMACALGLAPNALAQQRSPAMSSHGAVTSKVETAATDWARRSLQRVDTSAGRSPADLDRLTRLIGDARVVALSEPVHCSREPLVLRNRLAEHLIRHQGFTAVAIESGLAEGRTAHEWVRGGRGNLDDVLRKSLTWTFDTLPQNAELLRWMRDWNAAHPGRRQINFYGFDMSGSPGNHTAQRGVNSALLEALAYLASVDPVAAADFQRRLDSLLPRLKFSFVSGPGYESLETIERDRLTATIADIMTRIAQREGDYTRASSGDAFAWGLRSAIAAAQTDQWLRQIPQKWRPAEGNAFFRAAMNIRDRAQAENLRWIVEREGPSGKVLMFASRFHLGASDVIGADESRSMPAGTHLRRWFGDTFLSIGTLFGGGGAGCAGHSFTYNPPPAETMDGWARSLGGGSFLLDIRKPSPAAAAWLSARQDLFVDGEALLNVTPLSAYDVLLYLGRVTPSGAS
jgi:erythromycin esterase